MCYEHAYIWNRNTVGSLAKTYGHVMTGFLFAREHSCSSCVYTSYMFFVAGGTADTSVQNDAHRAMEAGSQYCMLDSCTVRIRASP